MMATGEMNKPLIRDEWCKVEEAERWEIIRRREGIPKPTGITCRLAAAIEERLDRLERTDFQAQRTLTDDAEKILLQDLQAWASNPDDLDLRSGMRRRIDDLSDRLRALLPWTEPRPGIGREELLRVKLTLERAIDGLASWSAHFNEREYRGPESTFGLALSGGGIRSATFNLGVLQALQAHGRLDEVDYLSTVSGGGYIGASLTYLNAREAAHGRGSSFPLSADRAQLAWIRRHTRYLTPGDGIDLLALIAAYVRGFLINLALLVPPIIAVLLILNWGDGIEALAPAGSWGVAAITTAVVLLHAWRRVICDRKIPDDLSSRRWWTAGFMAIAFGLALARPETFSANWLLAAPIALTAGAALLGAIAYLLRENWLSKTVGRISDLVLGAYSKDGKGYPNMVQFEAFSWIGALGLLLLILEQSELPQRAYPVGFFFLFLIGLALVCKYLISQVFAALLSGTKLRLEFQGHRYFSVQYGDVLSLSGGLLLVGAVPQLHHWVLQLFTTFATAVSVSGVLSTAAGWFLRSKGNEQRGYVAILLRLGLALLVVSGLLWFYHIAVALGGDGPTNRWVLVVAGAVWLIAVGVTDINYVSMHRYYRNRLMEAYFGPISQNDDRRTSVNDNYQTSPADQSDNLDFANIDVGASRAPYPLVNTNQVTVGYKDEFYRLRGGDCFVYSPRFIGSDATAWTETTGDFAAVDLGTAMAISGAAVDPNTGETRSWPLRIIMAMLNARLGYWLQSPAKELARLSRLASESWTNLILREMIKMPSADSSYVRLSDGGHFENLGLYELARRRCRLIVVSDAGADPDFNFSDLARAVERLRVDFGAHVELDVADLIPDKETRLAKKPVATGLIRYADQTEAALFYVKTTLFPELPQDVAGYAREHEKFPDESTADQFFSEEQFEAYRELGFRAGKKLARLI